MSRSSIVTLAAFVLAEMAMARRPRKERTFLMDRGWLPFGMGTNGHEGWGKMIDGKAVVIDEPEALAMEGWKP